MNEADLLKVLGEPTRFRILSALLERRHCVRSLSRKLGISESAVSQHLKLMRAAGLVERQQYGYHAHFLPCQDCLDRLADLFSVLKTQSARQDRVHGPCQCEYRKEEQP